MNGVEHAEMAVLGSCLAERDSLRVASAILVPMDFLDYKNAELFRVMLSEYRDGGPCDVITLGQKFGDKYGGMEFLFGLTNSVPSALHIEHYCGIVRAAKVERDLVAACKAVSAEPANEEFRDVLRKALMEHAAVGKRLRTFSDIIPEYLETIDKRIKGDVKSFPTKFPSLNTLLTGGGFQPGQLLMVGARTSRGKSALLLKMACDFAARGVRVLFISAEMTAIELTDRKMSQDSNIPLFKLTTKRVRDHLERVTAVAQQLTRLDVKFGIGGRLTMERVASEIDAANPEVVVIDYVQRFSSYSGEAEENRAAFFSEIANGLKTMAMTRSILVVTASQLGRRVEYRDDKTPTLADLKESGGLEEAPDQVLFIHVPADPGGDNRRVGELILAKQRNGPIGKVPVMFVGDTTDFQEIAEAENEPFG